MGESQRYSNNKAFIDQKKPEIRKNISRLQGSLSKTYSKNLKEFLDICYSTYTGGSYHFHIEAQHNSCWCLIYRHHTCRISSHKGLFYGDLESGQLLRIFRALRIPGNDVWSESEPLQDHKNMPNPPTPKMTSWQAWWHMTNVSVWGWGSRTAKSMAAWIYNEFLGYLSYKVRPYLSNKRQEIVTPRGNDPSSLQSQAKKVDENGLNSSLQMNSNELGLCLPNPWRYGWYNHCPLEENWFSLSRHLSIVNSSMTRGGTACPLLSSMLGFRLAWACEDLVCAVIASVSP